MDRIILKKKPLVEAIFELRWDLQELEPGIKMDPHYNLLIGGLYERLKSDYPFHQQLPSAGMPNIMAEYLAQHRFRKGDNQWPLVQIGPGIITVNDTEGYIWEDFERRIVKVVRDLFDVYPNAASDLRPNTLTLRYIDAMPFDFDNCDILLFLREKMNLNIRLHHKLFEETGVEEAPKGLDLRFGFKSSEPQGSMRLRLFRGRQKDVDALIWETIVTSVSGDLPKIPSETDRWLEEAHDLTNSWFFKLIEGELLERFR